MLSAATSLQFLTVILTSLTTGSSYGLSYFGVEAVIQAASPSVKVAQWQQLFQLGHDILPFVFGFNAILHWIVSYMNSQPSEIAAGICCVIIIPFTIVYIYPVNRPLEASVGKDDDVVKKNFGGAEKLDAHLRHWAWMNGYRASMPFAGALITVYHIVQRIQD